MPKNIPAAKPLPKAIDTTLAKCASMKKQLASAITIETTKTTTRCKTYLFMGYLNLPSMLVLLRKTGAKKLIPKVGMGTFILSESKPLATPIVAWTATVSHSQR